MTKSNPDFLSKPNISMDRSSYIGIFDFLNSPFEQQVSDPDEFYFSYEFFNSCDIEFVPADSISLVDLFSHSEVDLEDYKPSSLGSIESSSVDSALTLPFVEDSKATCVSTKVTRIGSFLLNIILMLLFLGDRIFSWIHNCLLALPCCSSYYCICMYPARAFEPDVGFHTFSSLYKPSYLFSSSLSLVSFYL